MPRKRAAPSLGLNSYRIEIVLRGVAEVLRGFENELRLAKQNPKPNAEERWNIESLEIYVRECKGIRAELKLILDD